MPKKRKKEEEMYDTAKALLFFLALLNSNRGSGEQCFRIRKQILIEHEETTLEYIATMYKEIERQRSQGEIRNSTSKLILESLSRMSNGWCKPDLEKENTRQERSLALAIAALVSLGTFILGPAIAALLNEITENTKWRKDAAHKGIKTIEWMEDMEKKLVASQKVEEILASIMLHESIMADLIKQPDKDSLNRTWRKVFKIMIETYAKNGFSKAAPEEIHLEENDNLLPREAYHYTVTVHTNDNCKHAKIKIKAVGVIPHSDCLFPYDENYTNTEKGYIKLKTDRNETCIYTGNNTIKLADNSIFSVSNSMVGPCHNFLLEFNTHENTLIMNPKHDRAYMRVVCKGNKDLKQVIYKDELVAPPSRCTTWVSDTKGKRPDFKDFMDMEEEFINSEDGSTLEGNINMTRNSIIFLPFKSLDDLKANKEIASKEYLAIINSLFNKDNEEQKQGNEATKVAISVTCTLVLMATCMFGWKRFKRSKPVTYLTILQRPEERQTKQIEAEEKDNRHETKDLERRQSAKEHEEELTKHTLTERQFKMEEIDKERRGRIKETEGHYDVPRILYGRGQNRPSHLELSPDGIKEAEERREEKDASMINRAPVTDIDEEDDDDAAYETVRLLPVKDSHKTSDTGHPTEFRHKTSYTDNDISKPEVRPTDKNIDKSEKTADTDDTTGADPKKVSKPEEKELAGDIKTETERENQQRRPQEYTMELHEYPDDLVVIKKNRITVEKDSSKRAEEGEREDKDLRYPGQDEKEVKETEDLDDRDKHKVHERSTGKKEEDNERFNERKSKHITHEKEKDSAQVFVKAITKTSPQEKLSEQIQKETSNETPKGADPMTAHEKMLQELQTRFTEMKNLHNL